VLQQLTAVLQAPSDGQLHGELQGRLAESAATFQVVADFFLGSAAPTGHLQLTAEAIPLTLFTPLLPPTLLATSKVAAGTLQIAADIQLQAHTLRGTVATNLAQMTVHGQQLRLQNATLTSEARLEADMAQQTLQLDGQSRLHVVHLHIPADLTMTDVTLTGPWQLSYTSEGWHVTGTPSLLSQAVEIGRTAARLRIAAVQGELSLHGNATTMDLTALRLHTKEWSGTTAQDTPMLTAMTLAGAGSIDLQRQRLTLPQLVGTVSQLGEWRGSGIWDWAAHTVHDLHLRLAVGDLTALQDTLQHLLPNSLSAWHMAGQSEVHLHATRLHLHSPHQAQGVTVRWQVHDGSLSTPEGTYASEHLNGTFEAVMTLDEATGHYALQGTLTMQPFALLLGNLFVALEANHLTSVVTFAATYSPPTEQLQLYVAGQFHDLGMLTVRGTVHQPLRTPRADLQLHARNINLAQFWSTFIHDAVLFPTLSQAQVQGIVNVTLDLLSQPADLALRGTVDMAQGQLQTPTVALHGLSLLLPVQLQYPLPQTAPEVATLPPESFGHLHLDTLQMGNVDVHNVRLKLALWSDNLFIPDTVSLPLLGGQITLERMTAQHLLQPHRQLTVPLRLRHLDLQRLHRDTAKLPLAGILEGDFSPLQIRGDRLETHGALTVHVAGGVIQITDLQGSDVFSGWPTFGCTVRTEAPLSLLRLTDIYPIGDMGGTLHFSVTDLTFTGREPATFNLEFAVQEQGGEAREITIRALNNLLFTTGSTKVAAGVFGDTYRLPYRRFGAVVTLRHDTLQLRGKYHDSDDIEYFMQAPLLGGGVSIVNRVPNNRILFRDFVQRLKATVLEKPDVRVQ
jgi:hypothetical protein